jgi:alkanesulfonate monooxygenase SsuD/methylene tetrahydromethanopterin reductase-like flavin-dependent oxidoreductase (luciferase family)
MRALWATDGASFDGEFASFTRVSSNPKPPNGSVRIVVGGHSRAAAERAGRLGDGLFPGKGSARELAELLDIARQTAAANDRDPAAIELTAGAPGGLSKDPAGAIGELEAVGVSRVVVPAFALMKPNASEAMAAFAERVMA